MRALAGQVIARKLLEANIREGKTFHAFLFTGPEGIGKLDAAAQFACVLNGLADLDEDCTSDLCRRIRENRHPDVRLIQGEGASVKIEQMREMIRDIQIRPRQGKWKIFIIRDAERMSLAAANSVLKILEEPPSQGMIILLTAYPAQILPTIRSRCQTIPFRPLSAESIRAELQCSFDINAELAHMISGLAEGMPAKALAMAENPVLVEHRNEVFADIEQVINGTQRDTISLVREYERNKSAEDKLRLWCTVIRDILVWRLTNDPELLYHRDKARFYDSLKNLDVYHAVEKLKDIEKAVVQLQRNYNTGLVIRSALGGFSKVFTKEETNG